MNKSTKLTLLITRLSMGWLMFYAGIVKVLDPEWSAAGYLSNAQTFPGFYEALTNPSILPIINFLNEWGLTLIGLSLIVGAFVRWTAVFGAVMMVLYYFPVLDFPFVGDNFFIIDDHIIYALVFVLLAVMRAGRYWGLDGRRRRY